MALSPTMSKALSDLGRTTLEITQKVDHTAKAKREQRVREYRQEASRLASMANKRIKRIEEKEMKNSPAYERYIKDGGAKFSVRGKTHNELQAEVARMNRFLNATTSTIRGINNTLKEMAANTGIKFKNLADLHNKAGKFFELASKVEQYLRSVEDIASAIGYQRIWQAINTYVQNANIDLSDSETKIDSMIEVIGQALTEQAQGVPTVTTIRWYKAK